MSEVQLELRHLRSLVRRVGEGGFSTQPVVSWLSPHLR
jgi:hypothetical protein